MTQKSFSRHSLQCSWGWQSGLQFWLCLPFCNKRFIVGLPKLPACCSHPWWPHHWLQHSWTIICKCCTLTVKFHELSNSILCRHSLDVVYIFSPVQFSLILVFFLLIRIYCNSAFWNCKSWVFGIIFLPETNAWLLLFRLFSPSPQASRQQSEQGRLTELRDLLQPCSLYFLKSAACGSGDQLLIGISTTSLSSPRPRTFSDCGAVLVWRTALVNSSSSEGVTLIHKRSWKSSTMVIFPAPTRWQLKRKK